MSLQRNETPPPTNVPNESTPAVTYGCPTESSDNRGRYGSISPSRSGRPTVASASTRDSSPGWRSYGGNTAGDTCIVGAPMGVSRSASGASRMYTWYLPASYALNASRAADIEDESAGLSAVMPLMPPYRFVSGRTAPVA